MREIDILKKVKGHPGFPKIVDWGITKENSMFIAQEKLGETLFKITKGQKQDLKDTLRCGLYVLETIEALHSLGYIHGDIKADNYMTAKKRNYT